MMSFQVDFNGFASCLISVCEICAELVAQEPRLLNIESPVYVLGKFISICFPLVKILCSLSVSLFKSMLLWDLSFLN